MTFMNEYFAEDARVCEEQLNKIGVFIEASYRELGINYVESEIKVLKESGTEDDLSYLMEEAQETFKTRAVGALKKIPETLKEWFEQVKKKFIKFFEDIKQKHLLNTIKDAIKKNPKVANAVVEVDDNDEYEKELNKISDKIKGKVAKIRGKKNATKEDIKEIEDLGKEATALKPNKRKFTIGSLIPKFEKKAADITKKADSGVKSVEDADKMVEGIDNPEAVAAISTGVQKISVIEKLKMTNFIKFLTDIVHKSKKVSDNPEAEVKESADTLDDLINSIITESDNEDDECCGCCDEVKEIMKDLKDALDEHDVKKAAKIASDIKDKLDECCDDKKGDDEGEDEDEEVEESVSFLEELESEIFG